MKCLFRLLAVTAALSGAMAEITGTEYCSQYMCITGRHDSGASVDTYILSAGKGKSIPQKNFGWMAMGFGEQMLNSPMIIAWPNSDGSLTISQRQASAHAQPTVVDKPLRKATLLETGSFANTTDTAITFAMPSDSGSTSNKTMIIWAYGSKNPGNKNASANIAMHTAFGTGYLALMTPMGKDGAAAQPAASPGGNAPAASGTSGETDSDRRQRMLQLHVLFGALATMLCFPLGILVPRLARGMTDKRWWFGVHSVFNGLIGFAFVITAFAIARSTFGGGFDSLHRQLGLALFLLCILQVLLGIFVHYMKLPFQKLKDGSGRGPSNYLHTILGVALTGLGFGTVWQGIVQEWERSGRDQLPVGWKVGWGIVVAVTSLTYLAGVAIMLPRQLRRERNRRNVNSRISMHAMGPAPGSQLGAGGRFANDPKLGFARQTAGPPGHQF